MNNMDLILNAAAQNLIDRDDAAIWFGQRNSQIQNNILCRLAYLCLQAHPVPQEIDAAIDESKLKPTFTPCVLMRSHTISVAIRIITDLPNSENIKSFRLLISLLAISDRRRREAECVDGCSHEWHNIDKDLLEDVLASDDNDEWGTTDSV